jgi:large subunit ribosomal protein L25
MANILELNATTRQRSGSSSVRRLRKEGLVPGVVYGRKTENANIKVNTKTVTQLLKESATDNILVNLQIDGSKTQLALIQKVQHDHLKGGIDEDMGMGERRLRCPKRRKTRHTCPNRPHPAPS